MLAEFLQSQTLGMRDETVLGDVPFREASIVALLCFRAALRFNKVGKERALKHKRCALSHQTLSGVPLITCVYRPNLG